MNRHNTYPLTLWLQSFLETIFPDIWSVHLPRLIIPSWEELIIWMIENIEMFIFSI